jgi:cytochrome P450
MIFTAVMRETIRLSPSAPMRGVQANEDTTIGHGKYFIPKGHLIRINVLAAQRDHAVWGEDVSTLIHHSYFSLSLLSQICSVLSGC